MPKRPSYAANVASLAALALAFVLIGSWLVQRWPATPPTEPAVGHTLPLSRAANPQPLSTLNTASLPAKPGQASDSAADPYSQLRLRLQTMHSGFQPQQALAAATNWPALTATQHFYLAQGLELCSRGFDNDFLADNTPLQQWLRRCKTLPIHWHSRAFVLAQKRLAAEQGFYLAQLMMGFESSYQADQARRNGDGREALLRARAIEYFEAAADQGTLMALAVLVNEYADVNNGEYYQPVKALGYLLFVQALLPGYKAPGVDNELTDLPYYDLDSANEEKARLLRRWQKLSVLYQ
ncbi:hypothetical protein [Gallaecimonas sp. GXIMD1310]|uniref:hypothetical protein n=1 Tax=Gallaecimonas sp. GXIMD1310 TaxID=3131926 RepID=UPI0032501307